MHWIVKNGSLILMQNYLNMNIVEFSSLLMSKFVEIEM